MRVYGGVRLDLEAEQRWATQATYPKEQGDVRNGIRSLALVAIDLPVSAVADTLTLPVTICAAATSAVADPEASTRPDLTSAEPQPAMPAGQSPPKATAEKGAGPVSKDQARAIANRHFGRREDSGCFQEDRGKYFFVAPPYIMAQDAEHAGVYIDKKTGDLFTKPPAEGMHPATSS